MFIFLVDNSPLGFLFYLIIPRSIQVPESFPVVIVIIIIIDFQLCCEINTFALLQRHLGCVNIFAWVQKRKRRGEFSEKNRGGEFSEKKAPKSLVVVYRSSEINEPIAFTPL